MIVNVLDWNRQLADMEAVRRRVYAVAAFLAALIQSGVAVLDIQTHNWADLPSTLLGTVLAAGVVLALTRWRLRLELVNHAIAALATLAVLADLHPALHQPSVVPHQYLSFILLTTLWFGLLPVRTAAWLSSAAYLGFAALVLGRPEHDLMLLTYLLCVTAVVGLAASFGQHVTTHMQETAAFQQQSLTDPLTGLPNRRAMLQRLNQLWADGAAGGSPATFALLMIDLDHFKAVNDQYSHTTGDQVLMATGPALRALSGPDDIVARWGGEEFMLLLPDTTARRAYATAARLNGAVLALPDSLPPLTFSAGGALSHEAATLDQLLALVDQRLHAAKDAGRRQVKWDTHRPRPGESDERAAVH